MSDKSSQAERISRLMDGEIDSSLDSLCRDESATACWRRFHIIREAMRDHQSTHLCKDFSQSVMQALEQEPTIINPQSFSRRKPFKHQSFFKPVAGLAIAATVAAVTVLSFQSIYRSDEPQILVSSNTTESIVSQAAINRNMFIPARAEVADNKSDVVEDNLDSYLLEHMEQSGSGSVQGMLPYVRLTGYNNK